MFRKVLPHSLTISVLLAVCVCVWWQRWQRWQRRGCQLASLLISVPSLCHTLDDLFLVSIPEFFAAPRILYIYKSFSLHKVAFLLCDIFTIDTKFNKEKLVYLLWRIHTKDNLQCSQFTSSR